MKDAVMTARLEKAGPAGTLVTRYSGSKGRGTERRAGWPGRFETSV
jgi:hypothetical protein